jgi:DeoR/GlpR family transcriptional regulator of sugar metabolism
VIERKSPKEGRIWPPERRRLAIAERLRARGQGSVADLEEEFDVSAMTIRRDLRELERQGLATRTHGGATAPGLASHEDSFSQRVNVDVEVKQRLATVAAAMVEPGETVFIDSSSSAYFVARQIIAKGIPASIVTNSLPVMQLFASTVAQVELTGVGGWLRGLTLSLVGPAAVRTIRDHFADKLFMSVKGVAEDGSLTDPDALECEVKRAMIERAEESILLVQAGKFQERGSHLIASCGELSLVLGADLAPHEVRQLEQNGVKVICVD